MQNPKDDEIGPDAMFLMAQPDAQVPEGMVRIDLEQIMHRPATKILSGEFPQIELNQEELACIMAENFMGERRPAGVTAAQCMEDIRIRDSKTHAAFMNAAAAVSIYVLAQLNKV